MRSSGLLPSHISTDNDAAVVTRTRPTTHDYLLPNYRRRMLHTRWCRRWWEHAEAISRLEAIWQAWEAMRYDGATGMAVWWRDYADPHLRVLTDREGPFFECDAAKNKHALPEVLPVEQPLPGLFRDADHPEEHGGPLTPLGTPLAPRSAVPNHSSGPPGAVGVLGVQAWRQPTAELRAAALTRIRWVSDGESSLGWADSDGCAMSESFRGTQPQTGKPHREAGGDQGGGEDSERFHPRHRYNDAGHHRFKHQHG